MITALAKTIAIAIALQVATLTAWGLHASSLRGERDTAIEAKGKATADAATAVGANAEWQTTALEAQAALSQCQAQWAEATADAEFQAAAAAEHRRNAVRWAEAFAGRYAGKGAQCSAALAALDPACPELEGY